ncbi:GntR family transcriptional regulator [Vagococcus entomophilus]|uniref:GntR family transcriptional regulator n=1 Tax=Vagococcus entomophilus TaxID=1160095 RepID=A0A430AJR5_9ENTE|nr:GntR family transcriptional regulator [Vagococcus entomophilus]RSU08299.1 GntR family transcriptional regulator [Vagococcus entomophilus]
MRFDYEDSTPLYLQVANQIEESILTEAFKENEQIPSTTEISKTFNMNPATVLKGMNLLVDKQLIEKKRGRGMFVTAGAREKVQAERKINFFQEKIQPVIREAQQLNVSKSELLLLIERGYQRGEN